MAIINKFPGGGTGSKLPSGYDSVIVRLTSSTNDPTVHSMPSTSMSHYLSFCTMYPTGTGMMALYLADSAPTISSKWSVHNARTGLFCVTSTIDAAVYMSIPYASSLASYFPYGASAGSYTFVPGVKYSAIIEKSWSKVSNNSYKTALYIHIYSDGVLDKTLGGTVGNPRSMVTSAYYNKGLVQIVRI